MALVREKTPEEAKAWLAAKREMARQRAANVIVRQERANVIARHPDNGPAIPGLPAVVVGYRTRTKEVKLPKVRMPVGSGGRDWIYVASVAISFDEVLQRAAVRHHVSKQAMRSAVRFKDIVHARQEVYWLARVLCCMSYPQIGKLLGGRDHTTVMHGQAQFAKRMGLPDAMQATREQGLAIMNRERP
jgi:chromosomal replication initiation ATPase DnaA